MTYTSYADLYKIGEISFTGGSTIMLDFEVFSSSGAVFNIMNSTFTWKLSPYGNKDYVVLTKTNPVIINLNTVRFTLDAADTQALSGKYIQELTSVGSELLYGEFTPVKLDFPLTASPQTSINVDTNLTVSSLLYVVSSKANQQGDVTIRGFDENDVSTTETLTLNGTNEVISTNVFSTISSGGLDFPQQAESGDTVTVGAKAQLLEDVSEIQQGIVIISKKLG